MVAVLNSEMPRQDEKAIVFVRGREEPFLGTRGKKVLDYAVRNKYGKRSYLVDGEWVNRPRETIGKDGRPKVEVSETKYQLEDNLKFMRDVEEVWKFMSERQMQKPRKSDKILEQLVDGRILSKPVTLFSPWGPRYKTDDPKIWEGDPECRTLGEIREVLDVCAQYGIKAELLLMPADVYGIEINARSPEFVREYFKYLEECAYREIGEARVLFRPWSAIRGSRWVRYEELRGEVDLDFFKWVKKGRYNSTIGVAKVFNPSNPVESARRYCIERVVEGIMVQETFTPVKLSLVRAEKDALDGPLSRLYVIQNMAPWLGGK